VICLILCVLYVYYIYICLMTCDVGSCAFLQLCWMVFDDC
jgi:hypothetical protein